MLASSSMTMSPFLQLRIVLRPMNTPLPIVMPWLSVPFASRQHASSMTTLSPMWILCGCRSVTLAPKATLRPTRAEQQRIQLRAQEQAERAGHPAAQQDRSART